MESNWVYVLGDILFWENGQRMPDQPDDLGFKAEVILPYAASGLNVIIPAGLSIGLITPY